MQQITETCPGEYQQDVPDASAEQIILQDA